MFYFEAQPANADILGYGAAAGVSNRQGVDSKSHIQQNKLYKTLNKMKFYNLVL